MATTLSSEVFFPACNSADSQLKEVTSTACISREVELTEVGPAAATWGVAQVRAVNQTSADSASRTEDGKPGVTVSSRERSTENSSGPRLIPRTPQISTLLPFSKRPSGTIPADGDFAFRELVGTGVYEEPWQTNVFRDTYLPIFDALNCVRSI